MDACCGTRFGGDYAAQFEPDFAAGDFAPPARRSLHAPGALADGPARAALPPSQNSPRELGSGAACFTRCAQHCLCAVRSESRRDRCYSYNLRRQ